jgi:hypothetical protein
MNFMKIGEDFMIQTEVLGKKTDIGIVNTWRGIMIEVRQHDSLSGEQRVFLNKETLEKMLEALRGENDA